VKPIEARTRILSGIDPDDIPFDQLMADQRPTILRGVAAAWPLVSRGIESPQSAIAYLRGFEGERPVVVYRGAPDIKGRFFYDDTLSAMNFEAGRAPLGEVLGAIEADLANPDPPSFYIGSTDIDLYLPGLRQENDLKLDHPMFGFAPPIVSIWIGNRTVASAHYDMSNNLACCAVGRRRFTLFPPDQVANLYPGPLEPTPGGQVVSMVDFDAPDPDLHPRFAEALAAAEVAELEPGDMLFYPTLWWHHVEALESFNVLINYWWNSVPAFMDTPQNSLLHAMLSLRDRPEAEKQGWRALFDYYVFDDADRPARHLPEHARGNLAPMDDLKARRLRAYLLNRLNR
jgi:hypothetical protein